MPCHVTAKYRNGNWSSAVSAAPVSQMLPVPIAPEGTHASRALGNPWKPVNTKVDAEIGAVSRG